MSKNLSLIFLSAILMFGALSIYFVQKDSEIAWQKLAKADLKKIKNTIEQSHPGSVDEKNPEFNIWLYEGYILTKKKIKEILSFEGYKFALAYYVSGFKDSHLSLDFLVEEKIVEWPGFLIFFKDNNFYVNYVDNGVSKVPPQGSELIECNDMTPQDYMIKYVFPYYGGDLSVEAHWYKNAPYMLVDQDNPWSKKIKKCTFKTGQEESTFEIEWQKISGYRLKQLIKQEFVIQKNQAHVTLFAKNGVWIKLPTFNPQTDQEIKALQNVLEKTKSLATKNPIVLDLRGNKGGYGSWGTLLLENLFGSEFLENAIYPKVANTREWRVSKKNLTDIMVMKDLVKKQFGSTSEDYQYMTELEQNMVKGLVTGDNLVSVVEEKLKPKAVENPIQAQIFVITDYKVFSAALTLLDYLKEIPNVVQIGLPTNADTTYLGVGSVQLPSGIVELSHPMSVERGRRRENNQAYNPDYRFVDIYNDEALEDFIVSLYKKNLEKN